MLISGVESGRAFMMLAVRLPGDPPTLPDDVLDRAGRSRARRFRQGR